MVWLIRKRERRAERRLVVVFFWWELTLQLEWHTALGLRVASEVKDVCLVQGNVGRIA